MLLVEIDDEVSLQGTCNTLLFTVPGQSHAARHGTSSHRDKISPVRVVVISKCGMASDKMTFGHHNKYSRLASAPPYPDSR